MLPRRLGVALRTSGRRRIYGARYLTVDARDAAFHAQNSADFDDGLWGKGASEYDAAFSGKFETYALSALQMLEESNTSYQFGSLLDVGCGSGDARSQNERKYETGMLSIAVRVTQI